VKSGHLKRDGYYDWISETPSALRLTPLRLNPQLPHSRLLLNSAETRGAKDVGETTDWTPLDTLTDNPFRHIGSDLDLKDHAEIVFSHVRAFAFLKESDFFTEFERYDHVRLVHGNERSLGVYRLTKGSILEQLLDHRLDPESPKYFWVSTPDECLEVVGFSEPLVKPLAELTRT